MIESHLPVLQVIVPLMAAPLALLLRRSTAAWSLAMVSSWVSVGLAIALLNAVLDGGPISYRMGDWAAPWGIEYRVDWLGAFVVLIIAAIGAIVLPYARRSVEHEIPQDRIYLFYAMYLLCLAGLLGMVVTGDAFNLFVFLEISSLSSYVLISMGSGRQALSASFRYLIMGTIGATFYIIGVGMMYMMTGTLNMEDLSTLLPAVAESRTLIVALAFLTVGISLKLALFPLHFWLPNAYTYAPSAVTVFLASTATKVAAYVLIRIIFTVFGGLETLFTFELVRDALLIMALAAMFSASAVAIYQGNIKRMLAYSSLAQIGYIVLGIGLANVTGLTGGIVHLFNHALVKGALFMAVGAIVMQTGRVNLSAFQGLGRKMPFTMAAFTAGGLGLIGVPLTTGFVSKWYLVQGALESGQWIIAVLILLSSLLAVIYVWRVVEVAYFHPLPADNADVREAPLSMLVPMWVLVLASIYFGSHATFTLDVAGRAAEALMGGAP